MTSSNWSMLLPWLWAMLQRDPNPNPSSKGVLSRQGNLKGRVYVSVRKRKPWVRSRFTH